MAPRSLKLLLLVGHLREVLIPRSANFSLKNFGATYLEDDKIHVVWVVGCEHKSITSERQQAPKQRADVYWRRPRKVSALRARPSAAAQAEARFRLSCVLWLRLRAVLVLQSAPQRPAPPSSSSGIRVHYLILLIWQGSGAARSHSGCRDTFNSIMRTLSDSSRGPDLRSN
ncbi:hypothetical protein Zmor_003419 [Zophobas morio]|uniref:Uncharacterized protein n=1 Tax=Zophobas morio TaxID=2755281 RepID=A0AA38M1A2_9CUCU|nr:hypothetical protein Zmor_003419 [Zophobas morio]